jgi:hypothetical protein
MLNGIEWRKGDCLKYSEDECPTSIGGDIFGLQCFSYNTAVDNDVIAVMEQMLTDNRWVTDIAEATGLSATHVELIQYILCSAGLAEYGTSPRGCWPEQPKFDAALDALKRRNDIEREET